MIRSESSNQFDTVAEYLAGRLCDTAMWSGGGCTWTGDDLQQHNDVWTLTHEPIDPWVYGGTAGVARFLSWAFHRFGQLRLRLTTAGALRHSLSAATGHDDGALWSGRIGVACAAVECGALLGIPSFRHDGIYLGQHLALRVGRGLYPEHFDHIAGVAGMVVGLVYLGRRTGLNEFSASADLVASRLVEMTRRITQVDTLQRPGLAHGLAGIALALIEAYSLTLRDQYVTAACDILQIEQKLITRDNSDPFRTAQTASPHHPSNITWCHGLSGSALVRLRLLAIASPAMNDAVRHAVLDFVRFSCREAMKSCKDAKAPLNFNVCHGVGSAIELLTYGWEVLGDVRLLEGARQLGACGVFEHRKNRGYWRCGVPGGFWHPGLLLGFAGIGMLYLRLASPNTTPSVTMWS